MRALVLEDELILATLWQDVLETIGLDATVVTTISDAEQALLGQEFDLYILDYMIRKDTCEGLVHAIKGKSHSAPVVIITGADTHQVLEQAPVLKSAEHVLQKPVDALKLRDLICELLEITVS